MPVLRSIRTYRHRGKMRYIRLFRAWENMHRRVKGTTKSQSGTNNWLGLPVEWSTFQEFREWSLRHGYSRTRNSLDRKNPSLGYVSSNCQWVTRAQNTANQRAYEKAGDKEAFPDVPF